MKSAYELAMERMEQSSGPARKLTEEQRARVAEIEKIHDAKAAECRVQFDTRKATASPAEWPALQQELASDLARIEEKRQRAKDAIWNEAESG